MTDVPNEAKTGRPDGASREGVLASRLGRERCDWYEFTDFEFGDRSAPRCILVLGHDSEHEFVSSS